MILWTDKYLSTYGQSPGHIGISTRWPSQRHWNLTNGTRIGIEMSINTLQRQIHNESTAQHIDQGEKSMEKPIEF